MPQTMAHKFHLVFWVKKEAIPLSAIVDALNLALWKDTADTRIDNVLAAHPAITLLATHTRLSRAVVNARGEAGGDFQVFEIVPKVAVRVRFPDAWSRFGLVQRFDAETAALQADLRAVILATGATMRRQHRNRAGGRVETNG